MRNRTMELSKSMIEYLHILYAVWSVVSYYAKLFGMDAGEEPAGMTTSISEREGVTFIRFEIASTPTDRKYSSEEIREIMQKYLDYCILPSDRVLRPYQGGSTIYDIAEPLYIDTVEGTNGIWRIDIVYVDNPLAYKYIQEHKGWCLL